MSVPFVRFCRELPRGLVARFRSLRRDTVGAVAVVVAVMAPVLVGSMGLGGEVGYWYLKEASLQNAADVAAHASAIRLATGGDSTQLQSVADYVAGRSAIDLAAADLQLNNPPTSGILNGNGSAVEVIATESVPRLFSAIYDTTPVAINGRAVAVGDGGASGCVIALSSTIQNALTISGSAQVTLSGCDMVSNAVGQSFYMEGTSSLVSSRCIQTVGTAYDRPNLTTDCSFLRENADPLADPYASVPEPAMTGSCSPRVVGRNNTTTPVSTDEPHASGMESRRYCNGLELYGTVNFEPGLYIIEGGSFRIASNARINGDGVVFYLADGVAMDFAGSARITISAPASGTYAGILVFGSRAATTTTHILSGDSQTTLNGAIYTPSSRLEYAGSSSATTGGCTQFIGNTVQIRGSGTININCSNTAGNPADTGMYVRLME